MAVFRLGSDAYGMTVRQTVAEASKNFTSIGAIYTTLERLEAKGFISSWQGEATAERGGRAKRYFKIEGSGIDALREKEQVRQNILGGLLGGVA